jgi:hypothetical protein
MKKLNLKEAKDKVVGYLSDNADTIIGFVIGAGMTVCACEVCYMAGARSTEKSISQKYYSLGRSWQYGNDLENFFKEMKENNWSWKE